VTPWAWIFSGYAFRTGRRECSKKAPAPARGLTPRTAPAVVAAATAFAALVLTPGATGAGDPRAATTVRFMRGVCWVAGDRIGAKHLDPLVQDHVSWISQTPFGWQRRLDDPAIRLSTGSFGFWGESDAGLIETTRLAHARGIRVLLKPHVWTHDGWVGGIAMKSEADWAKWFQGYETFILHYADLAERNGIEALAVGTELEGTTRREREWRAVIARVRARYHGALVYCANWSGEVDRVRFWDALDWIGVQAYYPLSDRVGPSVEELCAGWRGPLARLQALSRRLGKPVVFTEAAASRPWEWDLPGNPSAETQARCYESLFRCARANPWIRGIFFWKWFPDTGRLRGAANTGYTPQNKPAERVMARQYGAIEQSGG
jgi:hypothetical protein